MCIRDSIIELVTVAGGGYSVVLSEVARRMSGEGLDLAYSDALFDRWLDFELFRWLPTELTRPLSGQRTYHGFR